MKNSYKKIVISVIVVFSLFCITNCKENNGTDYNIKVKLTGKVTSETDSMLGIKGIKISVDSTTTFTYSNEKGEFDLSSKRIFPFGNVNKGYLFLKFEDISDLPIYSDTILKINIFQQHEVNVNMALRKKH